MKNEKHILTILSVIPCANTPGSAGKDVLKADNNPSIFAAMLDIDWEFIFDLNEGSTTNIVPLLTDNKLFQLTSNGNLYIFQKDKTKIS